MGIIVMKLLLIVATALGLKFESGLKRPKDNQALLYSVTRYSDELANGDSADDKDLHEEGDMNDDVVDYNGGTNRGYGSARPVDFFAGNHIAAGHFGTVPRETSPIWG